MKITFSLFAVLISTISIFSIGCKQGQPAKTTVKQSQRVKAAVKKPHINDTLIFNDPALSALVQKTERLFSVFDTINTNGKTYNITKFKLNKNELNDIRTSSGDSVVTDTVMGTVITGVLSFEIANNLLKILNWKDIGNYDLTLLLKNHLGVTKSPDGKLYNFVFQEKTGGTYQSRISIIYYKPEAGRRSQTFMTIDDDALFNRNGYSSIDTIHTRQGVKYLLMGDVIGCLTCVGFYADLVHYQKGKFVKNFNYHVGIRADWSGDADETPVIYYDARLHYLNINYNTDDQTPACNCGKNGVVKDDGAYTTEPDEASKESVNCVYAFNGRSFVLKKRKIKAVK